jgi:hypothetical protein
MANERLIDKHAPPSDAYMLEVIGPSLAEAWTRLRLFLTETYAIEPVLQCGGPKYGWNLQHRKGGRPLCEMYPEHGSFTAMVVLGSKELEQAMARIETFGQLISNYLLNSPRYHDGCWMYMRVSDPATAQQDVADIEQLVLLKKKPPRQKTV